MYCVLVCCHLPALLPALLPARQELVGHTGYLSSTHFLSERSVLTASGDASCCLWDVERGQSTRSFKEHKADVMSVSGSAGDPHVFASGSVDTTCKVDAQH
jgi:WD40 repeat protein